MAQALSTGAPLTLVLRRKGPLSPEAAACVDQARARGIPIREETERDLWRMSRVGDHPEVLGLLQRNPEASLADALAAPGPAWLVAGAEYPSNVGSIIRTAELTGAAAVIVDGPFNRKARQRAVRVSMRADRFIPLLWEPASVAVDAARAAGRVVIGVEDSGARHPWDLDLTRPALLVVGGEHHGIPAELMAACHETVKLPMPGFIPSWSVQGAVAALAAEILRQDATAPRR